MASGRLRQLSRPGWLALTTPGIMARRSRFPGGARSWPASFVTLADAPEPAGRPPGQRPRPGQFRLRPEHRHVRQAVPAQRPRHRQVCDDLHWGCAPPARAATVPVPSPGRRSRPVARSARGQQQAAAWELIPLASAETAILGWQAVSASGKCLSIRWPPAGDQRVSGCNAGYLGAPSVAAQPVPRTVGHE